MPVYEYECKSCKKTYEIMQRFDDPPLQTCNVCGEEVKKLISNTTFVLKGSGWYITDYARKSEEKTETPKVTDDSKIDTSVKEETKSNGSSAETKSEIKPDITTSSKPELSPTRAKSE